MFDAVTGEEKLVFECHEGPVSSVALCNGGVKLVTVGRDGYIKLWEAAVGFSKRTLKGHVGPVSSVGAPENGEVVITGGFDTTIRVWQIVTAAAVLERKNSMSDDPAAPVAAPAERRRPGPLARRLSRKGSRREQEAEDALSREVATKERIAGALDDAKETFANDLADERAARVRSMEDNARVRDDLAASIAQAEEATARRGAAEAETAETAALCAELTLESTNLRDTAAAAEERAAMSGAELEARRAAIFVSVTAETDNVHLRAQLAAVSARAEADTAAMRDEVGQLSTQLLSETQGRLKAEEEIARLKTDALASTKPELRQRLRDANEAVRAGEARLAEVISAAGDAQDAADAEAAAAARAHAAELEAAHEKAAGAVARVGREAVAGAASPEDAVEGHLFGPW